MIVHLSISLFLALRGTYSVVIATEFIFNNVEKAENEKAEKLTDVWIYWASEGVQYHVLIISNLYVSILDMVIDSGSIQLFLRLCERGPCHFIQREDAPTRPPVCEKHCRQAAEQK